LAEMPRSLPAPRARPGWRTVLLYLVLSRDRSIALRGLGDLLGQWLRGGFCGSGRRRLG
jgi:hypothetical protein